MKNYCQSLIICFLACVLTGCASIVSDKNYPVTLSTDPSGAKVEIFDESGNTKFTGVTPTTATLRAGDAYFDSIDYRVRFTKAGYSPAERVIESSIDGWYWGNIIFGGLIGLLIVDPLTGAMFEIDESYISTTLSTPDSSSYGSGNSGSRKNLPSGWSTVPSDKPARRSNYSDNKKLERLRLLRKARDEGLITEEEFILKRKGELSNL